MHSRALLGVLAVLAPTALALAQSRPPNQRVRNSLAVATAGGFGTLAIALRDHDADGFPDYAVAAPNASDPAGTVGPGVVYVYSGRRGVLVRRFVGDQNAARFAEAFADPGDVNGDGVPDLVAGAQDHDAGGSNAGRLTMFSGATTAPLWTVDGTSPGLNLGAAIGVLADLDADGVRDLAIGEPGWSVGLAGRGRVVVRSGRTGALLGTAEGPLTFSNVGRAIASSPDGGISYVSDALGRVYLLGIPVGGVAPLTLAFDRPPGADGIPAMAFITGPSSTTRFLLGRARVDSGGLINNGRIQLIAGTTVLASLDGPVSNAAFGVRIAAGGDVDGDGEADFVVARSDANLLVPREVSVRRQDFSVIESVFTPAADAAALFFLHADVSGDARADWGQAIFSGNAGLAEAQLLARGLTQTSLARPAGALLATFAIDCGPARAGDGYWQIWSLAGTEPGFLGTASSWPLVPIVLDPLSEASLLLAGSPVFPGSIGALDPSGSATAGIALPAPIAAILSGLTLSTCVVALDAGGDLSAVTNPLSIDV